MALDSFIARLFFSTIVYSALTMADIEFEQAFLGGCEGAVFGYIIQAIVAVATLLVIFYVIKARKAMNTLRDSSALEGMQEGRYDGHDLAAIAYGEHMQEGRYDGHDLAAIAYGEHMQEGRYAGHNLQAIAYQ